MNFVRLHFCVGLTEAVSSEQRPQYVGRKDARQDSPPTGKYRFSKQPILITELAYLLSGYSIECNPIVYLIIGSFRWCLFFGGMINGEIKINWVQVTS